MARTREPRLPTRKRPRAASRRPSPSRSHHPRHRRGPRASCAWRSILHRRPRLSALSPARSEIGYTKSLLVIALAMAQEDRELGSGAKHAIEPRQGGIHHGCRTGRDYAGPARKRSTGTGAWAYASARAPRLVGGRTLLRTVGATRLGFRPCRNTTRRMGRHRRRRRAPGADWRRTGSGVEVKIQHATSILFGYLDSTCQPAQQITRQARCRLGIIKHLVGRRRSVTRSG